jgi:DNA polymerase theta
LLSKWLHANYYISRYRPIPIEEFVVHDNLIYPAENSSSFLRDTAKAKKSRTSEGKPGAPCRVIARSTYRELDNPMSNAMVALALETASGGYGALVFCGSRQLCQTNAMLISDAMPDTTALDDSVVERRLDLLASLEALPSGLDPVFEKTVIKGVGFHRESLTRPCWSTQELIIPAPSF